MKPVVLYVEDDPRSRKVMQLLLVHQLSYPHVYILEDSTNFLARANSFTPLPDIVFLDIHVTPYDGFEMLAMLRQDTRWDHVPVIALTASVMNEEVQRLRTAGFNGCIGKPLHLETFPELLQQILDGEEVWTIVN